MKRSVSFILILLIASFLLTLPVSALSLPVSELDTQPSLGDSIDAFLNEHRSNNAAVAVAVFEGDTDIFTRYFGVLDEAGSIPLDETSVLEWGSTTKLTVWLAAMQLWDRGQLDLDADISVYLPDGFFKNLAFDTPITMLNLMNHNAGFQETDFVLEVEDEADVIPLGDYLAKYQPRQVFEPGTVVAYSNWGAALAGYVVECISGVPFYEYAQTNIFAPLGMTHTAIAADLSDNAYVQQKRKEFVSYLPDGSLSEDNKVFILPYPAGMCCSTLSDFVIFAKALLNRDSRLLTAEGFDKLYSPSLTYTNTDLARVYHGFLVDYEFATPIVGHDGNTAGGSSRLLLDLENNRGMVVLTNQLGGSMYRTKMAELVFGISEHHNDIDGYYIPARNVFEGRVKLMYNLFLINRCHITSEMTEGLYINILPDRFEISTADYLVPRHDYRLYDALAVTWFVLAAMAALSGIVRVIYLMVKRKGCRLDLLGAVYGLGLGASLLALIPEIPSLVLAILALLLVLCGGACAICQLRAKRTENAPLLTKLSRLQLWSLHLCLIVTLLNYFMWDMLIF